MTPNKNIICDERSASGWETGECLNAEIGDFNKWYFYKDKVIGFSNYGMYFIIDDFRSNRKSFVSKNELVWKKELERQKLIPMWTKWFDDSDFSPELTNASNKYVVLCFVTLFLLLYQLVRNISLERTIQTVFAALLLSLIFIILFDWHTSI